MVDIENVEFERLDRVAKIYFKNLSNLADLVDKKKQTFYTYKNKRGIGTELLKELEEKLRINSRYIRLGEEPMMLTGSSNVQIYKPDNEQVRVMSLAEEKPKTVCESDTKYNQYCDLPLYYYPANAGFGYTDDYNYWNAETYRSSIFLDPGRYVAYHVSGGSMTRRGIFDGAIIVVDTKREPMPNDIVVVVISGVLYCKIYAKDGEKVKFASSAFEGSFPDYDVNGFTDYTIKGVVVRGEIKF